MEKFIADNKKSYFDYYIEDKFTAGIVLEGNEVKSVRAGRVNLRDSYVTIKNGEVWLLGAHISRYEKADTLNKVDERRIRKLLLTKKEILKMATKIKKENYTIVPLELFLVKGFAKLEIGLAKGKKLYDKREDLTKKTQKRDIERLMKK